MVVMVKSKLEPHRAECRQLKLNATSCATRLSLLNKPYTSISHDGLLSPVSSQAMTILDDGHDDVLMGTDL